MSTSQEKLARLRNFNAMVLNSDPALAEETADLRPPSAGLEAMESPQAAEDNIGLESIVLRRTRPVLAIRDNDTKLDFIDKADSEIWLARLTKAKSFLDSAIRAVGRIDLQGARLDWVGTGWLVADNILVTNRHVAREFAARKGDGYTFQLGLNGPMSADVDFLQEIDNPATLIFKLIKPLHIEDEPGPDLSFFEVEITSGNSKLATPIKLAANVAVTPNVATIGYPAYDSRIPEPNLMEDIFGKTYNKKRLAPGGITSVEEARILHSCTTLGGNSGSAVIDLDSGEALGLHFSGSFLATNYAVRSDVVKQRLDSLRAGTIARPEARPQTKPAPTPPCERIGQPPGHAATEQPRQRQRQHYDSAHGDRIARKCVRTRRTPQRYRGLPSALADDSGGVVDGEEAVAEDYRDREGYQADFLGDGKLAVGLPAVQRGADDILDFQFNGKTETELRYEHYSVVMSRSRRMCFFSAVNIDGNLSKKNTRAGWKWDPRIPKAQQIMNECYGSPPKFSRGHMTRREDPGWGEDAKTAKRGNEEFDARHQYDAADAGLQRADLARARGLRARPRQGRRDENLGVYRAVFRRSRSGDVRRADSTGVLEDHRVHPRRDRKIVRDRL